MARRRSFAFAGRSSCEPGPRSRLDAAAHEGGGCGFGERRRSSLRASRHKMKLNDPHLRGPRAKRNYPADEPMHPLEVRAYRKMSVAEKLDRMAELHACGCALLEAGIRMRHPEWSAEQVREEVRARA